MLLGQLGSGCSPGMTPLTGSGKLLGSGRFRMTPARHMASFGSQRSDERTPGFKEIQTPSHLWPPTPSPTAAPTLGTHWSAAKKAVVASSMTHAMSSNDSPQPSQQQPQQQPQQQQQQARPTLSLAAACGMQPENTWVPSSQPQHEQQQPQPQPQLQLQQQAAEQAKLGPQHMPPTMAVAGGACNRDELPSLLKSSRPPVPPPTGLPPALGATEKEPPPEVAGNEDCIILD